MRPISLRHWFMMLLIVGIVCELGFIYRDTLVWMKTSWIGYPPDRAGLLVPPLFLWMAYVRLKHLPEVASGAPYAGFCVIVLCLVAFILARIIDINFIQSLSLVGFLFGVVVCFGGKRLGAFFLFPFIFLALMIPSVSYLIESIAGSLFRHAVLFGSYILLNVTGGSWQMHPAGLISGEAFLHVGFPRGGPSSLLFMLIVHFVLTECFIKKEWRKFFFMVHFPLYFVVAYIIFYSLCGWTSLPADDRMGAQWMSVEKWIPTMLFFLFSGAALFLAERGKGKRSHRREKGTIAW